MSFIAEISVTEKCNLGCPYCYVANRNSFMTFETFQKSIEKIHYYMFKSGTSTYKVSFFGGEPLLNFELIKNATPVLKADKKCTGFNIISNMTLIDQEKYDFIKKNNVGVSWSFDGINSNTSRPLLKTPENKDKNGNLYKNILNLYNDKKDLILGLTQGCKVTIWPGNCSNLVENFKFFLDYGINFPDFSLVRDNVWSNEDVQVFRKELHNLADFWMDTITQGVFSYIGFFKLAFLDSILGLTKGKRPLSCFAGTKGCAVASNGDFYPCQRFASKQVMKYNEDFNFKYYQDMFDPRKYEKCKNCDLYMVCNTGCHFSQILNDNDPLDCVCDLHHIIYEETFRIVDKMKNNKTFKEIIKCWIKSIG